MMVTFCRQKEADTRLHSLHSPHIRLARSRPLTLKTSTTFPKTTMSRRFAGIKVLAVLLAVLLAEEDKLQVAIACNSK
jgi:hypothetical protein